MRQFLRNVSIAVIAAHALAAGGVAETLGFTGAADAKVTPVVDGVAGAAVETSLAYPSTAATLPLQAVARIIDEDHEAAGVCGAQFADPTTVAGPDTDEFAIQFALASITDGVGFTTSGRTEELREVRFTSAELGNPPAGTNVELEGRLFLDGALAIFANQSVTELSGTSAQLRVIVTREAGGQPPQTVFDGGIQVDGRAGLNTGITFEGEFPTFGVFTTDLSAVDESLAVFRVVVFPGLVIPYTYSAAPGETFALRAAIEVQGAIPGGGAGAAAVLGTPIQVLTEVVTNVSDGDTASKMTAALEAERENPTGGPAADDMQDDLVLGPFGFLRACGLFGVESLVLLSLLCGLSWSRCGCRLIR